MDESTATVQHTASPRLMVVMFTDLVNSTALKEQLGHERYRKLKAQHDSFIRRALSIAPSGSALQDTGDGYFLSFGSVAHAVSAALLFQWLMGKEQWPHPFTSRVGIHLGEVEEGHSDVTGRADFISSAIDLASRTMSLAVGGQILLTRSVFDTAHQVVREHPRTAPEGAAAGTGRAGAYRFKGAAEPVDVFEVGAVGVAPLKPPPDSEKATRVNSVMSTGMTRDGEAAGAKDQTGAAKSSEARSHGISRRRLLHATLAAVPAAAAGIGVWIWHRRPDPIAEMRRLQIERDVAFLKGQAPAMAKAAPADIRQVDRIDVSDNAGFDILADNRVVDMRGWKEVPPEKIGELHSHITTTRRLQLRKNSPAEKFEIQGRTSGLDVVLSCDESFPYTYEAQRVDSFVGLERMKVRKINIDVSGQEVGHEFNLHVLSTYWNSIQTEAEQWFGLIGYKKSFVASLLLLFPANRPFKTYSLKTSRTDKEPPTEFTGPRILLSGDARDWIYWEVPNPEPRQVYRLHWTW